MKERNITVTLEKAKEWYNSENATLKELALKAFDENELTCKFKQITTFKDACEVLNLNYNNISSLIGSISMISRASAAMFKLNIVRKALNLGQDLHLTKDPKNSYIYYPNNPFMTDNTTYYKTEIDSDKIEIIGKIKSEGKEYYVLNTDTGSGSAGLGYFNSNIGVGFAYTYVGFLGCASREIAHHLGKYFGMLIIEAKYGSIVDFEVIDSKYKN